MTADLATDTGMRAVCDAITAHTYRYANEIDLHRGLEAAMRTAGLAPHPEVRLGSAGRIDFLAARVGIEVKVQGEAAPLLRQITRYARRPEIDAILVVTTRRKHAVLPDQVEGKPVQVLVIGGPA